MEVFRVDIYQEFFKRLGSEVDWKVIDDLVISDANILRPVKGHAFEILFDEIITKKLNCIVQDHGGDSDIDRVVVVHGKSFTMQLKTPAMQTIKNGVKFGVNLHKTHGPEKRPQNLYPVHWPCPFCKTPHDGEPFPDFLIVLHPSDGVLIVPKDEIPKNTTYPGHYADPAYFLWNSEWLNRWDLLGISDRKGENLIRKTVPNQHKLPKIAKIVNLTDEEIVSMWLKPENFRMIDMNLKGNLREPVLTSLLEEKNIPLDVPKHAYPKYDRITKNSEIRIQIKGISKSLTNISKDLLGSEVMGTHGKGAIRCYSENDFDYLAIVIDPNILQKYSHLLNNTNQYHFCLIPVSALPLHYKNQEWNQKDKIYPLCKFHIIEMQKRLALVPYRLYQKDVSFREAGPWFIDQIPDSF